MPSLDPYAQHDKRKQMVAAKQKFAPDVKKTAKKPFVPQEDPGAPEAPWDQQQQDDLQQDDQQQYNDEQQPGLPEQPAKTAAVDWDNEAARLEAIANSFNDLLNDFQKYDQLADIFQEYLTYLRQLLQYQSSIVDRQAKNKQPAPSPAVEGKVKTSTLADDPDVQNMLNKKAKKKNLFFVFGGVMLIMISFYLTVILAGQPPINPIAFTIAGIGGALVVKIIK